MEKSIDILNPKDCTGCLLCLDVCPCNCIEVVKKENDFLYPYVNKNKCIQCAKCSKLCPVINQQYKFINYNTRLYAAWTLDDNLRYSSTSGGIFSELAKEILINGGFVVGASYDTNFMVEHKLIKSVFELEQLKQSKYTQSNCNNIYNEVLDNINRGYKVLFSGTPCQCMAMYSCTNEEQRKNLLIVDFICRGVNSPKIYREYLNNLTNKYSSEITKVWFKNKKNGWNNFGTQVEFKNGNIYFGDRDTDEYMLNFLKRKQSKDIRPCCYDCKFKGISRLTDVTLADFWGVKLLNSNDDMRNGVSAVLIQSQRGDYWWKKIKNNIYSEEHELNEILKGNPCINDSVVKEDIK